MVGLLRAQTWHGVVWLGGTTATEGGGGAPARRCAGLELTELEQRALEDAVGCWGGGGAVAVVLEWPGVSCSRLWRRRSCGSSAAALAGAADGEEGAGNETEGAGRCGRVLAGLRPCPGAAWPARSGRWRRAAAAGDTRRTKPETGRPCSFAIQFASEPVQCLTTSFVADFSANPSLQRANSLHRNDRPMYQLQLLFKDRVPILNVN